MKSTSSIAALLLGAGLAVAKNEKLDRALDPRRAGAVIREVHNKRTSLDACLTGISVGPILGDPGQTFPSDPNFDFFSFCNEFLQPTVVVTKTIRSTAFITTTQVTGTKTYTATTTAKNTAVVGGTSVYCPIPSPSAVCGLNAWGYAENNIYSGTTDSNSCHQLCLANTACKSFQTQDGDTAACNLYSTFAVANATIPGAAPFFFYDRDCPNYLPAGCNQKVPPSSSATSIPGATTPISTNPPAVPPYYTSTITSAPATTTAGGISVTPPISIGGIAEREEEEKRAAAYTIPGFLAGLGTPVLSLVCDCLVTTPVAPLYTTLSVGKGATTVGVVVGTTTKTTITTTVTAAASGGTAYVSVAK